MTEHEHWQWQEPGSAWKGAGLYHIILTVTDRQPVLGALVTPGGDPTKAKVARTALGDALIDCLMSIHVYRPEVRVLHFCLMPDHLHAVLYVQRRMEKGIGTVARGFWQAAKKLGRACSYAGPSFITPNAANAASFITPNDIRGENKEANAGNKEGGAENKEANSALKSLKEGSRKLQEVAAALQGQLGDEGYYRLRALFTEMPFIRPMARYSQLQTTIRYIDMNPQRLATKRLKPGYFRVQKNMVIGGRSYDGVGNAALLMEDAYAPVHVRRAMVVKAQHGDDRELRDYKNACVMKARQAAVMVSPFISPDEKQVMQVLLREQRPFILLTDNGFRDYYKPADALFDACAAGRLLILSPWQYDGGKRHISRADCVALNAMAEDICVHLNNSGRL